MRDESLLCQLKRRFRPTTDSAHPFGRYPNLTKDAVLDAPDRGWVADITYVRLPTTFCYAASILDDYSRYCVGWALSRWIDTRLTISALEMALAVRRPEPRLIHHSDQGVQYASGEYVARLEDAGARISIGANEGAQTRLPLGAQALGGPTESLQVLRRTRPHLLPVPTTQSFVSYRAGVRVAHGPVPLEPLVQLDLRPLLFVGGR